MGGDIYTTNLLRKAAQCAHMHLYIFTIDEYAQHVGTSTPSEWVLVNEVM